MKPFPPQLTHLVAVTFAAPGHGLTHMTFYWKIKTSPVPFLISIEKSNQFCLVFFSLSWSIRDRPGVAGPSLEHKGHYWWVISGPRTVMWCPNCWPIVTLTKCICQDGDLSVRINVFCFYSTVFRSKYSQGPCLTVWVLYFIKMEEMKVEGWDGWHHISEHKSTQ